MASTNPAVDSRQLQLLIWAVGEARRNRRSGAAPAAEDTDLPPIAPAARTYTASPPARGSGDFVTEWQPMDRPG